MEELWKKKLVATTEKEKGLIGSAFDFPHRFPLAFSMWKTLKNREFTLLLAKNGEFSTFDKIALSTPRFPLSHIGKRFFSPHPFFNSQRVFHTVFNICGKLVENAKVLNNLGGRHCRSARRGGVFYVRGKPHLCRAVPGANSRGSAAVIVDCTPMGNISLLGKKTTCGFSNFRRKLNLSRALMEG